jgi:type I restriction enzyme S subunit
MSDDGQIPKSWSLTILGEIGEWCGGGTPSKENHSYWTDGTVPWVSPKDMKSLRISGTEDTISQVATQETNVKPFPPGTVLVVVRSGILARTLPVAVCDVTATMNQDLKGIKPFSGIEPLYVAYYMMGNERNVLHQCCKSGTTVASIEVPRLKLFPIRLPPTNEQRRIVAKIEELLSDLDAGVAALERIRANLRRYRAAVLKAAVEGKLTEEWRAKHPKTEPATKLLERILADRHKKWEEDQLAKFAAADKTPRKGWREKYVEPADPDTSGLPELPEGWCWATVEQICHQITDGEHNQPRYQVTGLPMLTATHIRNGGVSFENAGLIAEADFVRARKRCGPIKGDVLIVCVGATTGRAGIVDEEWNFALVRSVLLLRPRIDGKFLLAWVQSPWSQQWIRRASGASAQAHFYISDAKRMPVPLPTADETLSIINEVAEKLSQIDLAEKTVSQNLKRAARLRQSILKRAFEGKLVLQDPTDEPADKLLDRIRQERAAANGSVAPRPRRGRASKHGAEGGTHGAAS